MTSQNGARKYQLTETSGIDRRQRRQVDRNEHSALLDQRSNGRTEREDFALASADDEAAGQVEDCEASPQPAPDIHGHISFRLARAVGTACVEVRALIR